MIVFIVSVICRFTSILSLSERCLELHMLSDGYIGKRDAAYLVPAGSEADASCCFTLFSRTYNRTLNLEAPNLATRQRWLSAIHAHLTPQAKRAPEVPPKHESSVSDGRSSASDGRDVRSSASDGRSSASSTNSSQPPPPPTPGQPQITRREDRTKGCCRSGSCYCVYDEGSDFCDVRRQRPVGSVCVLPPLV